MQRSSFKHIVQGDRNGSIRPLLSVPLLIFFLSPVPHPPTPLLYPEITFTVNLVSGIEDSIEQQKSVQGFSMYPTRVFVRACVRACVSE